MKMKKWQLDPRCGLVLLILSNVLIFQGNPLVVQIGWLLFLTILLCACGEVKGAVKWLIVFIVLYGLENHVLPASPKLIATSFLILVNYMLKMLPCIMIGWLMVKAIPLRNMIAAMRLLHVPQKLIIAISVTLRYIPAIREETRHIREAIKLRNIHGGQKIEAFVVPLMISATATAEELSAAAVTRGIENPAMKTSLVELKLRFQDWLFMLVGTLYVLFVMID